jgi:hypothetical protein
MPINVRDAASGNRAGNRFVPARLIVPVGIKDPATRLRAIRELVVRQRAEPALGLLDRRVRMLRRLPTPVYTALFGSMLKGVGLRHEQRARSALRDVPEWRARRRGLRVRTAQRRRGESDAVQLPRSARAGINTDRAAVPDPEVFFTCVEDGFAGTGGAGPCGPDGGVAIGDRHERRYWLCGTSLPQPRCTLTDAWSRKQPDPCMRLA